jgi:fluoride exporter
LLDEFLPNVPGAIPWTTMLINVLGALVLALILISLPTDRPWIRHMMGTGLIGGFTTFSGVAIESEVAFSQGNALVAVGYPMISIMVSAVVVGMIFAVARR